MLNIISVLGLLSPNHHWKLATILPEIPKPNQAEIPKQINPKSRKEKINK